MKRLITMCVIVGLASSLCWGVRELRQSTAEVVEVGPFYDLADGTTKETALTVTGWTCQIFKNDTNSVLTITASGGNNDAAHIAMGRYSLELTAGNTDTLGRLTIEIEDANAVPITEYFAVIDPNEWDRKYSTGELKGLDLDNMVGTLDDAEVADDVKMALYSIDNSGADQTVDDLEDFADAGYDPSTNRALADVNAWSLDPMTTDTVFSDSSTAEELIEAFIADANFPGFIQGEAEDAVDAKFAFTGTYVQSHLKGADDNVALDPNTTDVQTAANAALAAYAWKTNLFGEDANGVTEDDLPTNFSSITIAVTGEVNPNFDGITGTLDAAEIGANALTDAKVADDLTLTGVSATATVDWYTALTAEDPNSQSALWWLKQAALNP